MSHLSLSSHHASLAGKATTQPRDRAVQKVCTAEICPWSFQDAQNSPKGCSEELECWWLPLVVVRNLVRYQELRMALISNKIGRDLKDRIGQSSDVCILEILTHITWVMHSISTGDCLALSITLGPGKPQR